jgi:hypothetical protein
MSTGAAKRIQEDRGETMNDRTKKLLESVGTTQARRRRRDRGKQEAVDAVLESARGARPSDALAGVDQQEELPQGDFAPAAANLEGPGALDGVDVPGAEGEEQITPEAVSAAAEKMGMKPVDLEGIDMEVLTKGAEHEKEHFDDVNVAAAIAAHHIMKHPTYYTALDKMEAELEQEEGEGEPTPDDEAEPGDDFVELDPSSMGGVDAEGGENEIED